MPCLFAQVIIVLILAARPGFDKKAGTSSPKSFLEPIPLTETGLLPPDYVLADPESHFIYVCRKSDDLEPSEAPSYPLTANFL